MGREIRFKSVSYKAFFISIILLSTLIFSVVGMVYSTTFKSTVFQTNFTITVLSILMVVLILIFFWLERKVVFTFENDILQIREHKRQQKEHTANFVIPYADIENYNFFEIRILRKKIGYGLRIKTERSHQYFIPNEGVNHKDEFNFKGYNELKALLDQNLKFKKTTLSDRLLFFLLSIFPQIAFVMGVIVLIGLFIYLNMI